MRRPIQKTLAFLVVMLHLGVLVYVQYNKPTLKTAPKRLVVKTKSVIEPPRPQPQKKKPQTSKPIAKKQAPKPKPKPQAKPKPVAKKKETPRPIPKKQEPIIPQKLWEQVENSIAQIEKTDHSKHSKKRLVVPELATPSQNTQVFDNTAYQQKLVACLHRSLSLPEHGDVTLEIFLNSDGSVAELKVISAESNVNRAYLEKNVPKVVFPPLDASLLKTEQKRFVLTFCNEI